MSMTDSISRQAAIDAIRKHELVDLNEYRRWYNQGLLFAEVAVLELPSAQQEIIHCRECKWWGYDDDDGAVRVCHAAKHVFMSSHWDIQIYRKYRGDFWCADAERRTDDSISD